VSKELLVMIIGVNAALGIFVQSWGNILIALIVSFILLLWINPGKYIRLKLILKKFSLTNTWVLMRVFMKLSWSKTHPWKINPPSRIDWINKSTIINEDFSYIITLIFCIVIPITIYGIILKFTS
jgi:hypothetical protein